MKIKKYLFVVIMAAVATLPVHASGFDEMQKGNILTSYDYQPMLNFSDSAIVDVNANTSDNVRIIGSTVRVSYKVTYESLLKARISRSNDKLIWNNKTIWNEKVKVAVEEAISSTFTKYNTKYIKENVRVVFEEVMDVAQVNTNHVSMNYKIHLSKMSFK